MSERSSDYWNSAVSLDEFGTSNATWRAHCDELGAEWIGRWLGDARYTRILKTDLFDEAVGTGLTSLLRECSPDIVGVDVSQEIVAMAQQRQEGFTAQACDVRELPFDAATFDAVVSPSTLDHFNNAADINRAIAELARVLRPGGRLLVSFDNNGNPLVRLRNALPYALLRRLGLVPYFVGATLDRRQLVDTLENAGFDVAETRAILHCPRVLAVTVLRLLDRMGARRAAAWVKRWCRRCEGLERYRMAYRTGYYVAALGIKR